MEIAIAIAARLKTGEPLTEILSGDGMPSEDAVEDWRDKNPEIERIITRARSAGFDAIALDALRIADESEGDPEEVASAKLRVETRLKLLAKWDRVRYGDHPNASASATVNVRVTLSPEERRKKFKEILGLS